jgi:hypothetical protein
MGISSCRCLSRGAGGGVGPLVRASFRLREFGLFTKNLEPRYAEHCIPRRRAQVLSHQCIVDK